MKNSLIINDVEAAMRSVGYTTHGYAFALSTIEQNQADWAEGFATICVDEALRQTGEYASFCHTDLKEWAAAVRRNIREVAIYIVGALCRSMCLADSADELSERMADSLYIDDYEPLKETDRLKHKISAVNLDSFFKPHKSMATPLPKECQEVVMKAKRALRRLFATMVEKLTKLKDEATRKEAKKMVRVTSWVKDLRRRKAEMMEIYGKSLDEDVDQVVKDFKCSRSEAIDMLIESQEGLLDDNPFYQLYEQCHHVETKFAAAVRRLSGSCQGAELDKFIEMQAKREWLEEAKLVSSEERDASLSEERGAALSGERGVRSEELAAPSLVLTPMQEDAFSLAETRRYMSRRADGTIEWRLKPVTLSYFLGRIFAGDYPKTDSHGNSIWHVGTSPFPEKKLQQLFSMKNVGVARRKGLGGNVPEEWEKIEDIINEIE